jgi:hypothetical protein
MKSIITSGNVLVDYLVILCDGVTKSKINLERQCESDDIMLLIWETYNPASLAALWRHNTNDVTTREGDVTVEAIIKLNSVTDTEVIYGC